MAPISGRLERSVSIMRSKLTVPIFLLTVATVMAVAFLQASLLLYRMGGSALHWGGILLCVPLLNGVLATLIARRAYLCSFYSSLISATVLLALYHQIFWKQAPSWLLGVAFFLTLALFSGIGVSLSRLFFRRRRRASQNFARLTLIVAYHLLAIAAAVVTLMGTLSH